MKSWGMRIGTACATGLLGLLAIAQAQRDRLGFSTPETVEVPAIVEPLKPIPTSSELHQTNSLFGNQIAAPHVVRGNDVPVQRASQIQQVGMGSSFVSSSATSDSFAPSTSETGSWNEPQTASIPLNIPQVDRMSLSPPPPMVTENEPESPRLSPPEMLVPNLQASPATMTSRTTESFAPELSSPIGSGVISSSPPSTPPSSLSAPSLSVPNGPSLNTPNGPSLSAPNIPTPSASNAPNLSQPNGPNLSAPNVPSLSPTYPSANSTRTLETTREPFREQPKQAVQPVPSFRTSPQPGAPAMEGTQTPTVSIQKKAPTEVKIGQPAPFVIHIRNSGSVTAYQVRVDDHIPRGMRLEDAVPTPSIDGQVMTWLLGDLDPGEERAINIRLTPEVEGELGSQASVSFAAAASVRTIATRPEIRIRQVAPPKVLIGQQLEIDIEISNPGTGAASEIKLEVDLPDGLQHPKGPQMDYHVGTLQPGEVRRLPLRMQAVGAGTVYNQVRAVSAELPPVEDQIPIEITAPKLVVNLEGPGRRFLERQANFELSISNEGTAPATEVMIYAYLDRGLSFVSTESRGEYDEKRHAVVWRLTELPPGQTGKVPLRLLPVEEGNRIVRLEARGDLGIKADREKAITVEALAELTFSVADQHDPIEVGSETTYEIRVTNHGSRGDTNVRLAVEIPPGLAYVSSDPPAQSTAGRSVIFPPLARMDSKGEYSFRLKVRGINPGTHILRTVLNSDASQVAVTKEESTLVYADQ